MALPTNKSSLIQWCLRLLGKDVVPINVSDEQCDDRVDQAIDYFTQFHTDAIEKKYTAILLTQTDINNKCVTMPSNCIGVTRIFPLSYTSINSNATTGGFNMFDISYQVRLNEIFDMTAADYVYFELANEHLATLELLFTGQVPIRYNRYTNILYTDLNWTGDIIAGNYIIAECYTVLDQTGTLFWNDVWLKEYATCLLKQQWGNNLKVFGGVKLPGGIVLNGQQIYEEATADRLRLEQKIRDDHEEPAEWFLG